MPITHQDIADRLDALWKQQSAAYEKELARINAERQSLRETCGGLGHVWAKNKGFASMRGGRVCAICDADEPRPQPAA